MVSALTAGHIFIVIAIDNDPPEERNQSGLWYISDSDFASHYPFTDSIIYNGFGTDTRKTVGDPATTLEQFNIFEVKSVTGEWTAWLNGVQLYTTGTNTVAFQGASVWLGRSLVINYCLDGDIAEVIMYPSGLGISAQSQTRDYLSARFGM